jgi:oligopeptide transport system substrate-binding protein
MPRAATALRLLALALALLPAACRRAPEPAAPPAKILHVGNGAEPQDLDPHLVTGVTEHNILSALLEGLVTHHPSGEGVAPGVATRWETSADRLTWTFHLRPEARWSNGDPVTSADFLRTYQRILTPSLGAQYAYKLHHVVGAAEFNRGELADFSATGFSAPDPHTLVLRLKYPVPYLLEALKHYSWFPVHLPTIERHGPADRPGNRWTLPANFVGNGPFVLQTWQRDQILTVTRSPTYAGHAAPLLDGIAYHPVDNAETEERMFRAGQLHLTYNVPQSRIPFYRENHPALIRIDPYYGTYFYRLNVTRPPLDDVRVRRALALAIDREAIVANILRAGQQPAWHFTPPHAGFTASDRLRHDLPEARRLLAEAGFPEGRGLRRIEILYNTSEAHKTVAEAIQQMWRTGLGVESALRNEEWKVYLDSQDNLAYDVARAGWIADYPDPHGFLDLWTTAGGNNDTGYANPAYDALLATALHAPDHDARFAIYRELDALLTRDVPAIPLYFYKRVYLIAPRVLHWVPNITDTRGWQYIDLAP